MSNYSSSQPAPRDKLYCFVSMAYNNEINEWVFSVVDNVCQEFGIEAFRSDKRYGNYHTIRSKVGNEIDQAFLVIIECSTDSYYVAFEMFHGMETDRKKCVPIFRTLSASGDTSHVKAMNVYSRVYFTKYELPLLEVEHDLEKILRDVFSTRIQEVNQWGRNFMQYMLRQNGWANLPRGDERIYVNLKQRKKSSAFGHTKGFFTQMASLTHPEKKIVIIGESGSGKSVWMQSLVDWFIGAIKDREKSTIPLHHPHPIAIFFHAKQEDLGEWLSDLLGKVKCMVVEQTSVEFGTTKSSFWERKSRIQLLDIYLKHGLLFIVFDGYDELKATEKHKLIQSLNAMADLGAHVILSCRKYNWPSHDGYVITHLSAPSDDQVIDILGELYDLLPSSAKTVITIKENDTKRKKEIPQQWLKRMIILRYILDMKKDGNVDISTLSTRSKIYQHWSESLHIKNQRAYEMDSKSRLNLWENIAFHFLKQRARYVKRADLQYILPTKKDGTPLIVKELVKEGILVWVDKHKDSVMFSHESLNEFFVASRMAKNLNQLTYNMTSNIAKWDIGSLGLDFLRASVYGFISEMVKSGISRDLGTYLKKIREKIVKLVQKVRQDQHSKLEAEDSIGNYYKILRNVVEFIGMTFPGYSEREDPTGEKNKGLVRALLSIIKDTNLNYIIRYNAARALTRIHPKAPKPYFAYTSDWDFENRRTKWNKIRKIAWKKRIKPNAVRGWQSKKRRIKPCFHPFAYTQDVIPVGIQEEVSIFLFNELFEQLGNFAGNEEPFLMANLSFALVRWYHPTDKEKLDALVAKMEEKKDALTFTYENLTKWLPKAEELNR